MATLSRGQTFGATETITNTKLHNLVDLGSVTGIVNADIDASANIVDTKLADITTGNKVRGTALSNLPSIPSGAGLIPFANIPTSILGLSLVSIPNSALVPLTLASLVDGISFRNLASTPVDQQFRYNTLVQSLASGGVPIYNGANNFVGGLLTRPVVFQFGMHDASTSLTNGGLCLATTAEPDPTTQARYLLWSVFSNNVFRTLTTTKFKKISGVTVVTVYARCWRFSSTAQTGTFRATIGGQVGSTTFTSATHTWINFDVDVSSLTNGTVYDVTFDMSSDELGGNAKIYCDAIVGFTN